MSIILRYLNPRNDLAFRKIFGTDRNKDILIHFLNDVLSKRKINKARAPIRDITFLNPILLPDIQYGKQGVIDVLCTDDTGRQLIVELQVAKMRGFEKRSQWYVARAYANQMDEGGEYEHLKEVVFLGILDFVMFPKKKNRYRSDHAMLDVESGEQDLEDFSFTFIELPKFEKNLDELEDDEQRWYFFLKHAHQPEDVEKLLATSDEVIRKAYDALEAHHWTKEELQVYEAIEKRNMDVRAREKYLVQETEAAALEKGIAIGEEKGIQKGRQEGIAIGEEKGIQKGRQEEKLELARKLITLGMEAKKVSEVTGLPLEIVKDLYFP